MRRDATERCLQRITEAAIKIGDTRMREILPNVLPSEMRGMGNLLRHHYDRILPAIIYNTVKKDLPSLKAACQKALNPH